MTNYYQVVGVSPNATADEIKKAFRRKAMELHPDQGGSDEAFRELKEAFEYLITSQTKEIEIGLDAFYDPFKDPNYYQHTFFAPENDAIAEFERSVRAQNCPLCHGRGVITKLVDPDKGFMGLEERFCKCQIVE